MNEELFAELVESVREGGAILRGEKAPAHKFEIEPPDVNRSIGDVISNQEALSVDISVLPKINPTDMWVDYDSYVDSLIVYFAKEPVESDHIYYHDGVSLLVESDSDIVVGYEIEAFEKTFLPKHPDFCAIWLTLKPQFEQSQLSVQSLGYLLPYLFTEQSTPLQPA